MVTKQVAALAALVLIATPTLAQDLRQMPPLSTQLYLQIPLDASTRAERKPVYGFAFRGARDYQVFSFNSRILNLMKLDGEGSELGGSAFDPTLLIIGGVAAGAAVLVGSKNKGVQQQQQQQVQTQQTEADRRAAEGCTQPITQPAC